MNHRQELADFLRKSRARRQPGEVGLAVGGRRRTPGLKREEVALLAGCKTVNRSPLPARCSPSISSVPKRTRSFPSANAATPLSRALCVKRSTALICTFASVSICASIRQESGSFGVGRSMTSFLSCSSTAASRRYSWPRSVEPVRGDTTASGHPSRTRRLLDQSAKPALPEFGATLPEAVGTLRLRGLAPHR